VIDSNDKEKIQDVRERLFEILSEDVLKECRVLILSNKKDLKNSMSIDIIRDKIDFNEIKQNKNNIFGCVAKTGAVGFFQLNYR